MKSNNLHNIINDYIYKYQYKLYNNNTNPDNTEKNRNIIISQIIFLYKENFPDNLDPYDSYIYWLDNNITNTIFKHTNNNNNESKKLSKIIDKKLLKNTNSGKNSIQLLENIKLFLLEDFPYILLIILLGEIYIQNINNKPKNNSFKTFIKNILNIN